MRIEIIKSHDLWDFFKFNLFLKQFYYYKFYLQNKNHGHFLFLSIMRQFFHEEISLKLNFAGHKYILTSSYDLGMPLKCLKCAMFIKSLFIDGN